MIRSADQRGYILLSVIVVITLVAAIALLMTTESALESNTAGSELDAQQAQYVAEAGLNHALWLNRQQGCGPYDNLTDEPLGNDKYSSNLTTDLGSTNAVTISVDQDSWIRSDQPTINKGTDLKLHTRNETAGTERPLLRYDLSPVAANASILSATAWFYVTNAHAAGPIDIHLTSTDWTETDATWDSMSTNMDSAVLATIPSQPVNNVWIQVNLTSQVQAWVNGQPNYGITLNSTVDGVHGQYNSRESANAPYLEVVVGTPPTSPALLESVGTTANGVSRTINRNNVVLYQHPTGMLHLQPDAAAGEDAEIFEQSPNDNYGASAETWVSSAAADTTRSLLRFNMGAIPVGARILSANLSLERQSGSGSDQPVSAHRLVNSWSEDSVTWKKRESSTNWDTAGGDFDNRSVVTTPVGPANDRYAWDITPLVQGWVNGSYPNYGVALVAAIDGMPGEQFHTSDDVAPTKWPSLSITYTCACDEVCLTPQGSGKIALIGDDNSPDQDDQLKIQIIESWGYEVDFYEDRDSDGITWSNYDLAYVSETVISGDVSANLSNLSIGVVNEEPELYDDLRLAGGDTEHVGSSIDIVDNSHFITSIFPLGALPIYAADMEILTADPALAGGLQILGELSGAASLTAIDQGAATTSGTAAGRRVTLPLGRHFASDFNWMHLNNNGRLIVQRAIEWGMSKDKGAAGNLLMVVAKPANLNQQDSTKKALIESWGYTVNLIDDGDSQTNIDTAAAANDVIYVSGSISGGALADKLSASLTPIVNEFAGKLDNFGFSSNTDGTVTTNTFTATNVSHHIGKPFAGGGVIHFTSSLVMPVPSGTLAPGLNSAASTGGMTWALPTLDAGAEAWDGLPVPARRVHLPFGAAQSSQLTDDGKILMRRALEWAVMPPLPLLPIAHWKLDETVGFSAVDSEGGHDGGLANGPSWAGGFHDGALQFDGNDDTVVVAHDDTLSLTEAFTFAAWINADTVGGPSAYQAVLTKGSTSAHNYWFGLLGTEVTLEFQVGGTWYDFVTSGIGLAPGNWYHIAATFDNFSNRVRLYLNGVEMLTDTMTATPQVNGENVLIGSSAFGGEGWPGLLDDVRIYDRALSDQEIAELAMVPQKLPIAHWKLDDTAGTVAIDSVGGNDGTLINWPASPDWVPGLLDGGLSFDGVNDYIDVSSMNPMSYDDFTIIAWYKSADMSLSDDEYIFMHGNGFVDALTFGPTDDGGETLRLATYVSDVTDRHYGTSDIVDQQWHHLVAVRSGGRIKLYVDGVKETDEVDAYAGITINVDGDGPFIGDYPGVTEQVHGTLDDVRFYDLGLDDTEIADLFAAGGGGGGGPGYTELYQPWSATADGSWQTVDLGAFGVPADAVVEVAVVNSGTRREYFGGVRAVGSSLERRFRLHEAEGGGVDTVTLHVQADASSQIEHYSDRRNRVSFVVLGFWADATYVERFDAFKAGANASWQPHNLGPYGVGSNQVAEISISQTSTSIEWLVGARRPGSGLARRISLHEAEDGGIDMVTLMAGTDASSIVEVYAEANSVVDFHLLGYWSTPPGSYIETGGVHGQATVAGSWLTTDLSSFGVPANSIAQFVMSNERDGQENQMGLRETGSTIPNRRLDLQEAESGGGDLGTMHVRVDASSQIQWSAEYGATEGFFYPVGWWVLSP